MNDHTQCLLLYLVTFMHSAQISELVLTMMNHWNSLDQCRVLAPKLCQPEYLTLLANTQHPFGLKDIPHEAEVINCEVHIMTSSQVTSSITSRHWKST